MARPRLLDRVADGHECIPAALIVHRSEIVEARQPAGDLGSRPLPAVVGRRTQPLFERCKGGRGQNARLRAVVDALIAKPLRAALVVAFDEAAHPTRGEGQKRRRLLDIVTLRQQPKRVKVALGDRLACRLVATLQLSSAKMRRDRHHDVLLSAES